MLRRLPILALAVTTVTTTAILAIPVIAAPAPMQVGNVSIDAQEISVTGREHDRTIPCEGRRVSVSGVDNRIILTGVCASLNVTGRGNTVELGLVPNAPLVVSGVDQTVRWRSTGRPNQSVTGRDNTITQIRP